MRWQLLLRTLRCRDNRCPTACGSWWAMPTLRSWVPMLLVAALTATAAAQVKSPTGKSPTGKTPTGKTPIGKTPTGKTPPGIGIPLPVGGRDSLPSDDYYLAYLPYLEGRFVEARKTFEKSLNSALRGSNGRWVDSIPAYAMIGECNYQLGNHTDAIKAYREAFRWYLAYDNFLTRMTWNSGALKPPTSAPRVPGFPEKRLGKLAQFPKSEPFVQGAYYNLGRTTVDTRHIKLLDAHEITRTLAIALRRYGELLGPLAEYDPLLKDLGRRLASDPSQADHWSRSVTKILAGVAQRAAGRDGQAEASLKSGLLAYGEFEHPLTAMALLELGHVALRKGQPEDLKRAGEYFEMAAQTAIPFFEQDAAGWPGVPDLIEEAFRYGGIAYRLSGAKEPFSPAQPMAEWAALRKPKLTHLHASLLLDVAESYAGLRHGGGDARQTKQADAVLKEARPLLSAGRGELGAARIGARFHQLEALVRYQQGNVTAGDAGIGRAMDSQIKRDGSLRLWHVSLLEPKPTSLVPWLAALAPVDLLKVYEAVFREPTAHDWQVDPLESLAVLAAPQGPAMERWFRQALRSNRGAAVAGLEIAEGIRRHRFCTALDLGGRLHSLRWLLEAPRDQLDDEAGNQRNALLAHYKEYSALSQQVAQLKTQLQAMPLVIDAAKDRAAADAQKTKLAEIARLSGQQEVLLRQMAVDRVHAPLLFPPKRSVKQVQGSLAKGQSLLIFFATSPAAKSPGELYAFLLTSDAAEYPFWMLSQPPAGFNKATGKLLREMGNFGRDREVPLAELQKTDWQDAAGEIYEQLFAASPSLGSPGTLNPATQELVIVPDSILWYLPFEALQVSDAAGKRQPLISKYRIRYAPTMSLAVPGGQGHLPGGNLAVAVGQLMPGAKEAPRTQAAFDELRRVAPAAVQLPSVLPGPSSVYATLFDRLIVLDDIDTSAGPLALRPIRGRTTGSAALYSPLEERLGSAGADGWLSLPWGGPAQVMVPGFHTAAEHALSEKEKNPAGMDAFLSTCGLMASGSRTILLSRWRTGGKTSFDLVREFAQELPQSSASRAWQRSVHLCQATPLTPDEEPRVAAAGGGALNGSHPFFWAGYLLVDTGVEVKP